jgi:hypothetical protein
MHGGLFENDVSRAPGPCSRWGSTAQRVRHARLQGRRRARPERLRLQRHRQHGHADGQRQEDQRPAARRPRLLPLPEHVGVYIGGGKVIEMGGNPGPLKLPSATAPTRSATGRSTSERAVSLAQQVSELTAQVRRLEKREPPLAGTFIDTATDPSDDAPRHRARLGRRRARLRPVRWHPIGGALPQAGDECMIVERDDGVWQVAAGGATRRAPAIAQSTIDALDTRLDALESHRPEKGSDRRRYRHRQARVRDSVGQLHAKNGAPFYRDRAARVSSRPRVSSSDRRIARRSARSHRLRP